MADRRMKNLDRVLAKLRKVPVSVQGAVGAKLKVEVDDLVAAQRRAAPVDEKAKNPGNFRDSIHGYPNPDRPLSFRILADARDEDGKFIGSNIEQGHRAVDGTHVAGRPSFWPTYRARKKGMKRRLSASGSKALRQVFPKE